MILKSKRKKTHSLFFTTIYFSLKREQAILTDFNAFPQHVIDYLKLCIRDQHNDTTPNK